MHDIVNKEYYTSDKLSIFHRDLGPMLFSVDIDSLLLNEFDSDNKPVAMIEYKHANQNTVDLSINTIQANNNLATMAGIPFFVCVYYDPSDPQLKALYLPQKQAYVVPVNALATAHLKSSTWFSEMRFSKLLHKLRGLEFKQHQLSDDVNWALFAPKVIY